MLVSRKSPDKWKRVDGRVRSIFVCLKEKKKRKREGEDKKERGGGGRGRITTKGYPWLSSGQDSALTAEGPGSIAGYKMNCP